MNVNSIAPEDDNGNIEYKLKLFGLDDKPLITSTEINKCIL